MVLAKDLDQGTREAPGAAEFLAKDRVDLISERSLKLRRSNKVLGKAPPIGMDQTQSEWQAQIVKESSRKSFAGLSTKLLGEHLSTDTDRQGPTLEALRKARLPGHNHALRLRSPQTKLPEARQAASVKSDIEARTRALSCEERTVRQPQELSCERRVSTHKCSNLSHPWTTTLSHASSPANRPGHKRSLIVPSAHTLPKELQRFRHQGARLSHSF